MAAAPDLRALWAVNLNGTTYACGDVIPAAKIKPQIREELLAAGAVVEVPASGKKPDASPETDPS